jgi:hypothetical protein
MKPNSILLRIRPSLPDIKEVSADRGPLMTETALSALHSLSGSHATVNLEIGFTEGKIGLFARSEKRAAPLVESQLYAQFPDAEMEQERFDPFLCKEDEVVATSELTLSDPEIFPIKRYAQFVDLSTRQQIDPLAGITSALVRYPHPSMRGHVQIVLTPMHGSHYRHKVLRFLPLLARGLSKQSPHYAKFFANIHLARGWKRLVFLPLDILMGGFRSWFMSSSKTKVSLLTGQETIVETSYDHDMEQASMRTHEREDSFAGAADKVNRLLFYVTIRVNVIAKRGQEDEAKAKVEEIAGSFRQFTLPQCNGLEVGDAHIASAMPQGHSKSFVLSVEEVATLWHVPNILVKTPNFDWVISKKLEPPVDLPIVQEGNPEDVTVLGEALFRGQRQQFGIRPDDRRRHMYVIGKTGMGKSTLLQNMIESDIKSGKGVAVIDPHGDLVESILTYIPKDRMNDVIWFDPADSGFPIAFNMLDTKSEEERQLAVSGLMSVFLKMWPEAFSGRMEYILRNTLLALTEAGGNSMLGIMRIFIDDTFRKKVMEHVHDHVVKAFWEGEYVSWSDKYRTEAIAALQNKIGQLLSTPLIRNIVGQVTSKLDVRHAMDSGKIILMNLSKGRLGEDNSAFLGSMFVTKFQLDAMSRADVPEKDRRDFYLYVDEFQNFATESFATILSEARKYRLNLTMAHQYVGQLLMEGNNTALKDAVFGNVGSIVSFQVGSDDAEPLSEQFEEMVLPKDILSLPKYHAYMRLMIKGIPSKPFSVHMLPPPVGQGDENRIETIKRLSRERYAEERKNVEEKISRWIETAKFSAPKGGGGGGGYSSASKAKEKEEEELKKARAKKMTIEQYRAWRDREMWLNDYNMYRKKQFLGEALSEFELATMKELEPKLEATGGIPPPSKTLMSAKEKAEKKTDKV